jgi:hypothetical protein
MAYSFRPVLGTRAFFIAKKRCGCVLGKGSGMDNTDNENIKRFYNS